MKMFFLILLVSITSLFDLNVYAVADEIDHHGETVETSDYTACLDCHDDKSDKNIEPLNSGCSEVTSSHTIDVIFPPKGKERLFNSTKEIVTAGILLSKGKITCLSCHNINKNKSKHLVIENIQSKLCLICHRL